MFFESESQSSNAPVKLALVSPLKKPNLTSLKSRGSVMTVPGLEPRPRLSLPPGLGSAVELSGARPSQLPPSELYNNQE